MSHTLQIGTLFYCGTFKEARNLIRLYEVKEEDLILREVSADGEICEPIRKAYQDYLLNHTNTD